MQYLRIVASLMPKDVNLKLSPFEHMTEKQLVARIRQLDGET